ncbi:MAG: type I secretion system permease/ATPase [Pseudomonadota bacterium]
MVERADPQDEDLVADDDALPESAEKQSNKTTLADAVAHLARVQGLPAKPVDIAHGFPVTSDGVSFSHLDEMAARAGLTVKVKRQPLTKVPAVSLPVAIFKSDGTTRILAGRADGEKRARVDTPLSDQSELVPYRDLARDYRQTVVYASPKPSTSAMASDAAPYRGHWFWSAVRRFWPNYTQVVVAALLINLLGLAAPLFIMNVYDRVIPNLALPTLWALTAGVTIAILFDLFLKVLRGRIVDETGRRVDMAVSGRLFDQLLGVRLSALTGSGGALASRIREFDAVRDVLTSSSVVALTDLLFIGVFLYVMWLIVGPLMLVPAITVPIVLTLTLLIQIPLNRSVAETQADAARRQGILFETIGGLETLKSIGAEGALRRQWDHAVAASSRSTTRARFWANLVATITATSAQAVSVIIIVWGVFLVIGGEITIGALIAANILSGRVLAPLNNVAQTLTRVLQARSAVALLNQIMALEPEHKPGGLDRSGADVIDQPALSFHDVTFTYPQTDVAALMNVSFRIEPGEKVGIIGRVGSGKSTIGRLASGLYDTQDGRVSVHGVDVRQIGPATLRSRFGYSRQDPELFAGTLRSNLLMGAPLATDHDLQSAIELSGVAVFASQHPKGLDMDIAERGRNLSSGQRQAVAIARLLIRSPDVLFLDEPSASMDARTELDLLNSLRRISENGVTMIISTHRDRLLDLVDRLIVVDQGRIVADGQKAKVIEALKAKQAGGGHG